MAAIHSRDTKPELYFRKLLFARGYRYRIAVKNVPGHPDLFLRKYNAAIFIHGCFWHRHPGCPFAYMPKSRVDFWEKKFTDNMKRDREVKERLRAAHIRCLVVWECTIKQMKRDEAFRESVLKQAEIFLHSEAAYGEF